MTTYTHQFYKDRDQATRYAAETILELVLKQMPAIPGRKYIESAIDIGCGVGTWLSVLQQKYGVEYISGCDGPWVDPKLLKIPEPMFEYVELDKAFPEPIRHYDLALSLEVAEHLPEEKAAEFVKFLTDLSDTVLFSAAIPGQGGTGHVNEQWPKYWADLFWVYGYCTTDTIRKEIWWDDSIPFWYRQNTLVFTQNVRLSTPLSLVHPELYLSHAMPGVNGSIKKLRKAVNKYVGKS